RKAVEKLREGIMSTALHADRSFDRALEQAGTDVDAERRGEAEIGNEGESRADQGVAHDRFGAEAARHADEQNDRSDGEPRRTDQDDVEHQPNSDPEERR